MLCVLSATFDYNQVWARREPGRVQQAINPAKWNVMSLSLQTLGRELEKCQGLPGENAFFFFSWEDSSANVLKARIFIYLGQFACILIALKKLSVTLAEKKNYRLSLAFHFLIAFLQRPAPCSWESLSVLCKNLTQYGLSPWTGHVPLLLWAHIQDIGVKVWEMSSVILFLTHIME